MVQIKPHGRYISNKNEIFTLKNIYTPNKAAELKVFANLMTVFETMGINGMTNEYVVVIGTVYLAQALTGGKTVRDNIVPEMKSS